MHTCVSHLTQTLIAKTLEQEGGQMRTRSWKRMRCLLDVFIDQLIDVACVVEKE